jgi:hypothetical protein
MADKSGGLTPQLAIMLRATWTQIHPDKPFPIASLRPTPQPVPDAGQVLLPGAAGDAREADPDSPIAKYVRDHRTRFTAPQNQGSADTIEHHQQERLLGGARLPWDPWASWSWDDYYRAGETYHPDNGLPHGDVGTTTKKL